jgi:PAS domain S-box-containing protein
MTTPSHARLVAGCRAFAQAAAAGVAAVGCLVLAGWAFDVEALRSVLPGLTAMNPGGTAVALLLAGGSLWVQAGPGGGRRLGRALAAGVVVIALLRIGGYLLDWDGGPDQLLFRGMLDREAARLGQPNRMAPNTAAALLMLGAALLFLGGRDRVAVRAAQALALGAGVIALLAVVGYAYTAVSLAGVPEFIPMALNTAVAVGLLAAGVLAARPDRGMMAVVTSPGAGGVMARRLLPAAVLIPVVVGWARWLAEQWGVVNEVEGLSALVVTTIVVFTALIWWNAASLDRADRQRRRAERRLAAQSTASAVLAGSPDAAAAVPNILAAIGDSLGWDAGAMWRPDGDALRLTDFWHAPGSPAAGFEAESRRIALPRGAGLPGRVWADGKPAWVRDVAADPNFPRAAAAARDGLRAAFALPVAVGGETLGVMEFFSREAQDPDPDLLLTLAAVGSQLGQFLKRRQAEDEAAFERHLLHSLLDTIPDSVYFKDARSRFIRVSKALAARHGLADPAEAVGLSDFDFFTEEHARPAFEDEREIMRTGRPMVAKEEKETWTGGTPTWGVTTKLPLRDPDGNIIGTFGITRDVTARKRAEEALRLEEERYRSLTEASAAIVWHTPASGEFESEQPGWSAYTGQTWDELKGWGWLEAVHPADRPHTAKAWSAAVAARSVYQVEHRLRRADGEYRHMLARAVPILDKAGGIREWVGVHTDIDAEKRAEAALREANAAALAATRAKSEFLANMSHEIRTPLNGIIGMTELALDTDLTADQREYLGLVKSSADHLLTVINDILDFSKIEAGKLDLECIDFDLRETLDDTVATLAARAHKKGLELAAHVAPDVPNFLAGDPHRLRQVVVNLVGNAIKFTEAGEVVLSVRGQRAEDRGQRTEDGGRGTEDGGQKAGAEAPAGPCPLAPDSYVLHFSVRDTGIGIAPAARDKLFGAFTQADTSTTRKYGGTGLGLAISSKLVGLMGGRIWLESEVGVGSTFHFTARFGPAEAPPAAPVEPAEVHNLPVLVVDDNATNRLILREMLSNWGMRPTVADGGPAALAALEEARARRQPFALVLLDGMMPGMDGFDLAGRIQADPDLVGATLMMLSSAGQREDAARCRELGIAAYLTKPVRQSTLLDAIMTAVAGAAADRPAPARTPGPLAGRRLNLLLAEDNAVNQRLAVAVLEKRGHRVVVAGNGREALEAMDRERFDAVLMDVQMPEMDGFEATAAIRTLEAATGRHTPVIAMTAHAMKGDREHCLEAGMDGYVSKPLRPELLFATLDELVGGAEPARGGREPPDGSADQGADAPRSPGAGAIPSADGPPLDAAEALKRAGGDHELLRELAGLCLDECPKLMADIRDAIARRDGPRLRLSAHALKGSVANFGAAAARAAAEALEEIGRRGDWADVDGAWDELDGAVGRLRPALAGLRDAETRAAGD